MPKAQTLYFISPRQIEIKEADLPVLKPDGVLVETICSAISAGTEMLVYRGQFPQLSDTHDAVSNDLKYPLSYGYASVGRVIEVGDKVKKEWRDKIVFAFQPHSSHFVTTTQSLFLAPDSINPENACFLPNMETAVNLVQDGAPILGERVLVLGQGVIGLLTASLLSEFPLELLLTVDQYERRRNALTVRHLAFDVSQKGQMRSSLHNGADLTFELSGSPAALNNAIELTTFSGRIVVGSWYGQKRGAIDLGGSFHRSRIKLISSQVSTISPELSSRWDKSRRFEVAWKAIERIQPEKWITQRFAIQDASTAYQLLDESPQETIQVVFDYSK